MGETTVSGRIEVLLGRQAAGDPAVRDEIFSIAYERLLHLTRKMLGDFPKLRAFEQTGDVLQNAAVRLCRAIEEVKPKTARDFFGLAALHIRRELLDLARHHFGRKGFDHAGPPPPRGGDEPPLELSEHTFDPQNLAFWSEFHRRVDTLPPDEREAVDLLWYQELPQEEAAALLGVDKSTVKRRWREARLKLAEFLEA